MSIGGVLLKSGGRLAHGISAINPFSVNLKPMTEMTNITNIPLIVAITSDVKNKAPKTIIAIIVKRICLILR